MALPEPDRFHLSDAAFTCELRRRERVAEIVLGGEVDTAARPQLDGALHEALGIEPPDALVVDLTAVTFADSSTLHWLTEVKRNADAAGAHLTVSTAPGAVRDLLAITGMKPHLSG
jgi:anti-sigma B factor antagonist